MLAGIDDLRVARGRAVRRVDLAADRPDDETLTGLLLGPSGNLRAPTIRSGRTMVVGFNEETYAELFG